MACLGATEEERDPSPLQCVPDGDVILFLETQSQVGLQLATSDT